jgi:hypothetical protein
VKAAGRGTRGAHLKHVVHGRDAGRVPPQRLVERRRTLPSRKGSHKKSGDRRTGRWEGVGPAAAQAACRQRTRLWRRLAGARAERTLNMSPMSVTLEVSQLEMSALKLTKELKRSLMSVMAETSHSAMGPYPAVAAATLALYSWAAVCRDSLLVKGLKGHAPEPPQAEPYAVSNAVLPAHAQRVRTLFASDKLLVFCRVERESIKRAATGGPGGGRAWARRRRKQRAGRGPDCGGGWQRHARSAPETCCSLS